MLSKLTECSGVKQNTCLFNARSRTSLSAIGFSVVLGTSSLVSVMCKTFPLPHQILRNFVTVTEVEEKIGSLKRTFRL